jgi:hypothetical protein
MIDVKSKFTDSTHRLQHRKALARSKAKRPSAIREATVREGPEARPLVDAELVQLHIRVIALENLVIAMLAEGSRGQLKLAGEMADFISPRLGFTPHRLTLGAAAEMTSLVERAGRIRR